MTIDKMFISGNAICTPRCYTVGENAYKDLTGNVTKHPIIKPFTIKPCRIKISDVLNLDLPEPFDTKPCSIKIPNLYKKCCLGIWEDKEEEERYNMERNKVLELYVKKNREMIETKYREMVEKEYNELPEVKEYNDLINTFSTSLEELANRYNNNFELNAKVFTQTGYLNQFAWEINPSLKLDINHKYQENFEKEMYELDDFANTIQAVLSISEDKDYQIEVLKNYDILDKKGKLNI